MSEDENCCFVLMERERFSYDKRSVPSVVDDHDVLLKVLDVGICGSDVHYWTNGRIGDFVVKSPIILGHETCAEVVKCGSKVSGLVAGDRVAVEPGVPCRRCHSCVSGRYNLCPDITFHATPPFDGTLCTYITHPADFCFKLPNHVSNEEGALLEPLSVGVHACRRGNVQLGSKVLIIGTGTIGLVNLLVARSMGADRIAVVDIDERRLALASKMGADVTVQATRDPEGTGELCRQVREGLGDLADVTIECSGSASAVDLGIAATRSGGCLVVVGMGAPRMQAPLLSACIREVDIRGVFRYANCFPAALSLVAQGRIDVKPLITHRFPFKRAEEAFQAVKKGDGVKVMINMSLTT